MNLPIALGRAALALRSGTEASDETALTVGRVILLLILLALAAFIARLWKPLLGLLNFLLQLLGLPALPIAPTPGATPGAGLL